jgi:hypothetical protein
MLRNLVLIGIALMVLSESARAQDASAILGKSFEYTDEIRITVKEGPTAKTTIVQGTRKVRITRDGRVFFTVGSGAGGEVGTVAKLNQTVDLARTPGMIPPNDVANYLFSSYTVRITFNNGLWRLTGYTKGRRTQADHSECTAHSSLVVAFSPDLRTCVGKSSDLTEICGPPSHIYRHHELVQPVSCTVSSD